LPSIVAIIDKIKYQNAKIKISTAAMRSIHSTVISTKAEKSDKKRFFDSHFNALDMAHRAFSTKRIIV
jgi:hypothetical protein